MSDEEPKVATDPEAKGPRWKRQGDGLTLEFREHAVYVPVPQTRADWFAFLVRRIKGKAFAIVLTSIVLTFFAFVNSMDVLLGFEATPAFIREFAKGEADRVRVERKSVHHYGPRLRDLPKDRSLMVLEVTSEVELTRRLDITCDMTDPGGHVDGYVRKTIDPDDLPGGIPAETPVALEIDFPNRYSPYGPCRVIEAR